MTESKKEQSVQARVQKMPPWLQDWYKETLAVISEQVPNDPETGSVPDDIDELIAFKLAVREYKRREQNKEAYKNAMSLVLAATEEFEFEAGTEKKFRVLVQPADGQGTVSMTIMPPTELPAE